MQPTYLPWAGYFNLLSEVDVFVFLDDVQFDTRSWQQRNRILLNGEAHWLTVPVRRAPRSSVISEIEIADDVPWRKKHEGLLRQTYGKHPFFGQLEGVLAAVGDPSLGRIADLNIRVIRALCELLELRPEFHRASELSVGGRRSEHLLKLCERVGCTTYLSPRGSAGYIEEDNVFAQSDITLRYQDYVPTEYTQKGTAEFVPYLSVVDAIANLGADRTRQYIQSNPSTTFA